MFRNVLLVVGSAAAILGCTAMQQQKSGSQVQSTAPAAGQTSLYKNLQVLPADITKEQLRTTMRAYSHALGVHCDHCHVAQGEQLDFPSDAKREKGMARMMIRMTRSINHDYLVKVTENENSVTCWTCHRGHETPEPEAAAPPPAEPGSAPRPPDAAPAPSAPPAP